MAVERGDSNASVGATTDDSPSTFEQSTLKGTTTTGNARLVVRDATEIAVIDTYNYWTSNTVEGVLDEIANLTGLGGNLQDQVDALDVRVTQNETDIDTAEANITALQTDKLEVDGSNAMTGAVNTVPGTFSSQVVDGATNISYTFNTTTSVGLTPPTADAHKVVDVQNSGSSLLNITTNSSAKGYGKINLPDSEPIPNNFYFGYSPVDTQYAGMFNDHGDFWLGVAGDKSTYINYYNGDNIYFGNAPNRQAIYAYAANFTINYVGTSGNAFSIEEGANIYFKVDHAGVTSFLYNPVITQAAPTLDSHATRKDYVDTKAEDEAIAFAIALGG